MVGFFGGEKIDESLRKFGVRPSGDNPRCIEACSGSVARIHGGYRSALENSLSDVPLPGNPDGELASRDGLGHCPGRGNEGSLIRDLLEKVEAVKAVHHEDLSVRRSRESGVRKDYLPLVALIGKIRPGAGVFVGREQIRVYDKGLQRHGIAVVPRGIGGVSKIRGNVAVIGGAVRDKEVVVAVEGLLRDTDQNIAAGIRLFRLEPG